MSQQLGYSDLMDIVDVSCCLQPDDRVEPQRGKDAIAAKRAATRKRSEVDENGGSIVFLFDTLLLLHSFLPISLLMDQSDLLKRRIQNLEKRREMLKDMSLLGGIE